MKLESFQESVVWALCRKENISAEVLRDAVDHAENGLADADLGGGVTKQRIARPSESKSKGYRCAVMYRKGDQAFAVYGFAKSDLGNIRDDEQEQFKKAAKSILALLNDQIRQLIENEQFEGVKTDG